MAQDPKAGGLCWNCRKPAAGEDNFCRFCGKSLAGFPWYYQQWGIILLTLLALGPFSLVLVWRSPVLSRATRWLYTVAILGLSYYLCVQSYHAWLALKSALSSMGAMGATGLGI